MKRKATSQKKSRTNGNRVIQEQMDAEKNVSIVGALLRLFLPKQNKRLRTNRYMLYSSLLMILLFFGLIFYLARFVTYESEYILASPYNKRTSTMSERVIRGDIVSADGKILATTKMEDGKEVREYPYGSTFAHVVGYATHGKSGLESMCNYLLLKTHDDIVEQLSNGLEGKKNHGDHVITTLDTRMQEAAYDALGDYRGAIVAVEPASGRVLCMVSKPDFNTNQLEEIWDSISQDGSNSCLVNRVTQGLYPPGSTYKIITTLEYMREHPDDYKKFLYQCNGDTIIQSVHIECYQEEEHGEVNLEDAFAESCNTAFVTLGSALDLNSYASLNEELFFNRSLDFDLKVIQSQFKLNGNSKEHQMPQTVIGQGDTLISPFHNAMIMCAIANDGMLMRPYLIDHCESSNGYTFRHAEEKEYTELMTSQEAKTLQTYLRKVVTDGTGYGLQTDAYEAAGKTGTAENSGEKSHSWFVGYCKKDSKADLVVCVLAENAGTGSRYAVPMAKKIFDAFYNR